jgi:hypothetical protein
MSTYETNLAALKKRYPALADRIHKTPDDYTVKVFKANPTSPMPTCTVKDPTGKEWLIHDKENPVREAEAFVMAEVGKDLDKAHIVVVFGLGLGYEFEALFNRYNAPGTTFIVVENNPQIFKKFLETKTVWMGDANNPKQYTIFDLPHVHFLIGVPPEQMYNCMFDIMHHTSGSVFTTFAMVEHPVLIRFNKPYYKPIVGEIARVCYDIKSSFGNDPEDSWLGMDHMLQNTDLICESPGIISCKDKFKDMPALIVATGPSLNKNIHLLKEFKDKAVFFAADASMNTFMNYVNDKGEKEPIVPDMVTSLERSPTTHRHFAQIPKENWGPLKDTFLCACPVVRPDVYENWHGKYCMMYRDFAHFRWLGVDQGLLNTGKSVTNMAWIIAKYMGCNPIILAGQDLAFANDGQTHVKGATHASEGLKKSPLIQQRVKCMGNDGQEMETLDTWVGMRKRFEYDIAKFPETVCINATEGGALIAGAHQMTLQEVLDFLPNKSEPGVKARLDAYMPTPSPEEVAEKKATIKKNIDKGYQYMNFGIAKIKHIKQLVDDMLLGIINGEMSQAQYSSATSVIQDEKAKLFNDSMCWYTMMHVMQSWLMGRDNILRACNAQYKGTELMATKLLKLYEMFDGLERLYNLVFKGTKEMYYDHEQFPKELPILSSDTYEPELVPIEKKEKGLPVQDVSEATDKVYQAQEGEHYGPLRVPGNADGGTSPEGGVGGEQVGAI